MLVVEGFIAAFPGRIPGELDRCMLRPFSGAAIGGMSGAAWLGLSGSAGKGEWKLRIKENGNGEDNIYSCRNHHDAKKMEKRISKHVHRR